MSNTITIKIEAPELAAAISKLADAMGAQQPVLAPYVSAGPAPAAAAVTVNNAAPAAPLAPAAPAAPPAAPVAPLAPEPVYTLEQLAYAATPLSDAGRAPEIVALLAQFGVQALTQLPKEHYGAFATALRGMGAKI